MECPLYPQKRTFTSHSITSSARARFGDVLITSTSVSFRNAAEQRGVMRCVQTKEMRLMSLPKADDESPIRGPYKIEDWGKTWLNPNKDRVLARVPAIALPDIAGYW